MIRLYTTNGREFHGRDEVRSFFADAEESGTSVILRAKAFEEAATPWWWWWIRPVAALGGRFAETHVRWTWDFRDGLIAETSWEPRSG